jgi:nitric oxide reductase large subunit
MQILRWLRMIGDTIFALGAIAFVYFAINFVATPRQNSVSRGTETGKGRLAYE